MKRNEINMSEEERYNLTSKQLAFCKEYLKTRDVVGSYKSAYNTNSTPNSISGQAYKVFNNVKVQHYIKEMTRQAEIQARAENRAIMDTVEIMEWWSSVINSQSRSIKMADRIKCSELLGKAHAMFTENIKADVRSTGDIVVNIVDNNEEDDEE